MYPFYHQQDPGINFSQINSKQKCIKNLIKYRKSIDQIYKKTIFIYIP